MSKEDFWGKRDMTSMARSLRLAVIQSQYRAGNLTEIEARDLLRGKLSSKDVRVFDDSNCLIPDSNKERTMSEQLELTDEEKQEILDEANKLAGVEEIPGAPWEKYEDIPGSVLTTLEEETDDLISADLELVESEDEDEGEEDDDDDDDLGD